MRIMSESRLIVTGIWAGINFRRIENVSKISKEEMKDIYLNIGTGGLLVVLLPKLVRPVVTGTGTMTESIYIKFYRRKRGSINSLLHRKGHK